MSEVMSLSRLDEKKRWSRRSGVRVCATLLGYAVCGCSVWETLSRGGACWRCLLACLLAGWLASTACLIVYRLRCTLFCCFGSESHRSTW